MQAHALTPRLVAALENSNAIVDSNSNPSPPIPSNGVQPEFLGLYRVLHQLAGCELLRGRLVSHLDRHRRSFPRVPRAAECVRPPRPELRLVVPAPGGL